MPAFAKSGMRSKIGISCRVGPPNGSRPGPRFQTPAPMPCFPFLGEMMILLMFLKILCLTIKAKLAGQWLAHIPAGKKYTFSSRDFTLKFQPVKLMGVIRQLPRKPRRFFDLFEEFGSGSIARLPKHQNGGFELHYIAKGHLHWEIEGRPFLVPPHSVFFTFPWEKHGSCVDFEPGHFFHFAVFRVKEQRRAGPKKVRLVSGFSLSETDQDQIFRKLLSARNRCFAAGP